MVYLALNIAFASSFTLCIKWVQNRKREDIVTVGMINYIVAAALTLPEFLSADSQASESGLDTSAILSGATMGACYFIAFFFVSYAIRKVGASASAVIGALSILMPISCGIFIWHEQPNSLQSVGVILAVLSLVLVGGNRQKKPEQKTATEPETKTDETASKTHSGQWMTPLILVVFFLLAGLSRLSQEAFKHESSSDHRPTFLLTAFVVSAIPAVAVLIARRRRITLAEFGFGFAMGASNILQTHFILKSLHFLAGFVVFPVSSAGGLLLTAIVATSLLGERLNRKTCWGIGVAVVALVLLNWLPGEAT